MIEEFLGSFVWIKEATISTEWEAIRIPYPFRKEFSIYLSWNLDLSGPSLKLIVAVAMSSIGGQYNRLPILDNFFSSWDGSKRADPAGKYLWASSCAYEWNPASGSMAHAAIDQTYCTVRSCIWQYGVQSSDEHRNTQE